MLLGRTEEWKIMSDNILRFFRILVAFKMHLFALDGSIGDCKEGLDVPFGRM